MDSSSDSKSDTTPAASLPSRNLIPEGRLESIFPDRLIHLGESTHLVRWWIPPELKESKLAKAIETNSSLAKSNHVFTSLAFSRNLCSEFDAIAPGLFVFHMGRCGSTLFGKMLDSEPCNRVFLEPNILEFIPGKPSIPPPKPDGIENLASALIPLLAIGANAGETRLIIKFPSFMILKLREIRKAFPEVPCYFIVRDPGEVLASVQARPTGILRDRKLNLLARVFGYRSEVVSEWTTLDRQITVLREILEAGIRERGEFAEILRYDSPPEDFFKAAAHWVSCPDLTGLMGTHSKTGLIYEDDSEKKRQSLDSSSRRRVENELTPLFRNLI